MWVCSEIRSSHAEDDSDIESKLQIISDFLIYYMNISHVHLMLLRIDWFGMIKILNFIRIRVSGIDTQRKSSRSLSQFYVVSACKTNGKILITFFLLVNHPI